MINLLQEKLKRPDPWRLVFGTHEEEDGKTEAFATFVDDWGNPFFTGNLETLAIALRNLVERLHFETLFPHALEGCLEKWEEPDFVFLDARRNAL